MGPRVLFQHLKPKSLIHVSRTTITSQDYNGISPTSSSAIVTLQGFSGGKVTPLWLWDCICKYTQWSEAAMQSTFRTSATRGKRHLNQIIVGLFLRKNDYNLYCFFKMLSVCWSVSNKILYYKNSCNFRWWVLWTFFFFFNLLRLQSGCCGAFFFFLVFLFLATT